MRVLLLAVLANGASSLALGTPWHAAAKTRRVPDMQAYEDGMDEEEAAVSVDPNADLNWLHTKLHRALDAEDYALAAELRNAIRRRVGVASDEASWSALGVPDWLSDRLERLNFPLPTRVQLHALRATEAGDDAAVCAPTGSGKTLSYLLPLLIALSDDLLSEDLAAYLGSAIDGGRPARASARSRALRKAALESENAFAEGAAESNETMKSEFSVPTPAVMVVVPARRSSTAMALSTDGRRVALE